MKKIYTLSILFSSVLLLGCSKDFLKNYNTRIIGTWRISDVDRVGIGGDAGNLPFREGTFTFHEGGSLVYVSSANVTYQGSWSIDKKTIGEETVRIFGITAIAFTTQQVITEVYDDMNFVSTDHFKTTITSGWHVYVTHFRR